MNICEYCYERILLNNIHKKLVDSGQNGKRINVQKMNVKKHKIRIR